MMEVFWFIIVVVFLVFGMYISLKCAKGAEKEEKGQGEYRFYLFIAALIVLATVFTVRIALQVEFRPWLTGVITAVTLFFSLVFISGKTNRVAIFTTILTLCVLALSVKSFLLL